MDQLAIYQRTFYYAGWFHGEWDQGGCQSILRESVDVSVPDVH